MPATSSPSHSHRWDRPRLVRLAAGAESDKETYSQEFEDFSGPAVGPPS